MLTLMHPMSTTQHDFYEALGLSAKTLINAADFIRLVRSGVSGEVIQRAIEVLDNRDLFVRILDTTSSNLSRYYRVKKLSRADSEETLDTLRLYGKAVNVFGNLEKAKEWIRTPAPALAGERPEALFDTFEGREWVSQVLRKIEYGEFT